MREVEESRQDINKSDVIEEHDEGYKSIIIDPKYLPKDKPKNELFMKESKNISKQITASDDFMNCSVRKHIKFNVIVLTTFIAVLY